MRDALLSSLVLFLVLFLGGCASWRLAFREGWPQEVTVFSFPAGADVYLNDERVGATPLNLELGRKIPHKITLEKAGYRSAVQYFVPQPNARERHTIKFGLLVDTGWYRDLTPEEMSAILDHRLVPRVRSPEPFEDIAYRILQADALLAQGSLDPLEHRMLTEKIVGFYGY